MVWARSILWNDSILSSCHYSRQVASAIIIPNSIEDHSFSVVLMEASIKQGPFKENWFLCNRSIGPLFTRPWWIIRGQLLVSAFKNKFRSSPSTKCIMNHELKSLIIFKTFLYFFHDKQKNEELFQLLNLPVSVSPSSHLQFAPPYPIRNLHDNHPDPPAKPTRSPPPRDVLLKRAPDLRPTSEMHQSHPMTDPWGRVWYIYRSIFSLMFYGRN